MVGKIQGNNLRIAPHPTPYDQPDSQYSTSFFNANLLSEDVA